MTTQIGPRPEGISPSHGGAGAQTTFDLPILMALSTVPSVRNVGITDRPSGTLVYVGLADMEDEAAVYGRLADVQAELGSVSIKVVCVPPDDWNGLAFSQHARLYSF